MNRGYINFKRNETFENILIVENHVKVLEYDDLYDMRMAEFPIYLYCECENFGPVAKDITAVYDYNIINNFVLFNRILTYKSIIND